MKASNFLAFLGGAVAGGLVGLLTAPRSGEETRKMVGEKMKKGAEMTKKELEDLGEWVKEKLHQGEMKAEEMKNDVKGEVKSKVENFKQKSDDYRN